MPTAVESAKDADMPFIDFANLGEGENPFTAVRKIGAEGHWIARTPGGYLLFDYEDCKLVNRDPRFQTPAGLALKEQGIDSGIAYEWACETILSLNDDVHSRIRKLAQPGFQATALEKVRPFARALLEEIVQPIEQQGRAEVSDLCLSYSVRVICHYLQWPPEDWEKLTVWADAVMEVNNLAVSEEGLAYVEKSLAELREYTKENLKNLRGREGDDLGSAILAAADEGDRLSERELLNLFETLLIAGTDTTKVAITIALYLFTQHPEQWAELAEDPSLVPSAVDEVLRFRPISLATVREAKEDVILHDLLIPAQSFLSPSQASANFDTAVYDNPETFDIHRYADGRKVPRPPHFTFGFGAHTCLGFYLARMELHEVLTLLPSRLKNLRIDETDPRGVEWGGPTGAHGVTWLPLAWDPVD